MIMCTLNLPTFLELVNHAHRLYHDFGLAQIHAGIPYLDHVNIVSGMVCMASQTRAQEARAECH
jgi:hypothetical protein